MYYQTSLLSFMANKLGRIDSEKGENCLLKQLFDKESESESGKYYMEKAGVMQGKKGANNIKTRIYYIMGWGEEKNEAQVK
jgi:hypothetical protein